MRTIKFRAWDEKTKYMAYQGIPDLETLQSFIHHFRDKQLMQFTGLHDQNGKPQVLLNALKEKHPRNEATFQRCFIPMIEEAMGVDRVT